MELLIVYLKLKNLKARIKILGLNWTVHRVQSGRSMKLDGFKLQDHLLSRTDHLAPPSTLSNSMDRALSPVAVHIGLDLELGSKWTVIYSKEFGKVFYYEFSL